MRAKLWGSAPGCPFSRLPGRVVVRFRRVLVAAGRSFLRSDARPWGVLSLSPRRSKTPPPGRVVVHFQKDVRSGLQAWDGNSLQASEIRRRHACVAFAHVVFGSCGPKVCLCILVPSHGPRQPRRPWARRQGGGAANSGAGEAQGAGRGARRVLASKHHDRRG